MRAGALDDASAARLGGALRRSRRRCGWQPPERRRRCARATRRGGAGGGEGGRRRPWRLAAPNTFSAISPLRPPRAPRLGRAVAAAVAGDDSPSAVRRLAEALAAASPAGARSSPSRSSQLPRSPPAPDARALGGCFPRCVRAPCAGSHEAVAAAAASSRDGASRDDEARGDRRVRSTRPRWWKGAPRSPAFRTSPRRAPRGRARAAAHRRASARSAPPSGFLRFVRGARRSRAVKTADGEDETLRIPEIGARARDARSPRTRWPRWMTRPPPSSRWRLRRRRAGGAAARAAAGAAPAATRRRARALRRRGFPREATPRDGSSRPGLVSLVRAVSRAAAYATCLRRPARAGPGGPGGGGGARGRRSRASLRSSPIHRAASASRARARRRRRVCHRADLHALLDTRGDAAARSRRRRWWPPRAGSRGRPRSAGDGSPRRRGAGAYPADGGGARVFFASGRLRTRTRNRDGRTRNRWRPGGPPRRVRARRVRASRLALRDGARVAAPRRERAAAAADRGDGRPLASLLPATHDDATRSSRGTARRGAQRRGGCTKDDAEGVERKRRSRTPSPPPPRRATTASSRAAKSGLVGALVLALWSLHGERLGGVRRDLPRAPVSSRHAMPTPTTPGRLPRAPRWTRARLGRRPRWSGLLAAGGVSPLGVGARGGRDACARWTLAARRRALRRRRRPPRRARRLSAVWPRTDVALRQSTGHRGSLLSDRANSQIRSPSTFARARPLPRSNALRGPARARPDALRWRRPRRHGSRMRAQPAPAPCASLGADASAEPLEELRVRADSEERGALGAGAPRVRAARQRVLAAALAGLRREHRV